MDKGNTAMILNPFLDGMKKAGADVELYYTKKLNIKACQGELHCWLKDPATCFQDDDMKMIMPKLREADVIVLASPLYVDGVNGPMKMLMDRMVPLVEPFIELRDDHCRHPLRDAGKARKIVLVSNCGFWEKDNFDAMITHITAACKNMSAEFAGALVRPHGESMNTVMEMGMDISDVFEAAREAGRQLVRDGAMSQETLEGVSRELMPREMFLRGANLYFEQELEASQKQ
jgi:multimeric flavodoxin WrbA